MASFEPASAGFFVPAIRIATPFAALRNRKFEISIRFVLTTDNPICIVLPKPQRPGRTKMVNPELEAFFKTLIVGERVNVMPPDLDEVMVREVTHVGERSEYGRRWLVWRWKAEGQTPWGTTDCGYGGQAIDEPQQVAA